MLVKSYQFTGIDLGHLGQLDRNIMKQSGMANEFDCIIGVVFMFAYFWTINPFTTGP